MKNNWQHIEESHSKNEKEIIEKIIKKWEEKSKEINDIHWETKVIL